MVRVDTDKNRQFQKANKYKTTYVVNNLKCI